jgi:hypothetical protein
MRPIFAFSLLFTLLFSACQPSASQNKKEEELSIKLVKYYVRYIEQSKELQVEAKFFNDNDSSFIIPSGVFVSDTKLEGKKLPKEGWVHRHVKRPAGFDSLCIFSYNISPTVQRKDTVLFPTYPDFKLATPKISKKTGGLVTWAGTSLTQEDVFTLIFEDSAGSHYTDNHAGITRGPQLEIRPEHIAPLAKGKITIRAVHKRSTIDKVGDTRMVRLVEYYRTPIEAEIVD